MNLSLQNIVGSQSKMIGKSAIGFDI